MGKRVTGAKPAFKASRHLRWESFEKRIAEGPPSLEPLKGTPRAVLFIEPGGRRVGLRIYTKLDLKPEGPLAELELQQVDVKGDRCVELATTNRALYREFYSFACVVADRLQLDRLPVQEAISETVQGLGALLKPTALMSEERQVGLIGELLFLRRVAKARTWPWAAQAWHGPDAEEHDFTLSKVDVEVKTTRGEKRLHHINSLQQLVPKTGRPLWLLSVQLTPTVAGAKAFTLTGLVEEVLGGAARKSGACRQVVLDRITGLGWHSEHAAYYLKPYSMRAPMAAVLVDDSFPAIVPETLYGLGETKLQRIGHVSYEVNVDGLGALEGTKPFETALAP